MTVWCFTICYNEERMLPFFFRNYEPWVNRFIIWDDHSTDKSREIIASHPKAELRDWPFNTGLDDEKFREAYNNWYREANGKADWVMWPDCDEFLVAPNPHDVLEQSRHDAISSKGFALISPNGWPNNDGKSQIYDLVKTGYPQDNYSKIIVWRPSVNMSHAHGRHTYGTQWPSCSGSIDRDPKFKLLHAHTVGGLSDTMIRNQRNYDRAHEKRFAWNYGKDANFNPEQVGSVAWTERLIAENKLINVA